MSASARGQAWPDESPLALSAEQGLIGSLLLYPDSYPSAAQIVKSGFFLEGVHAALFEAFGECRKAGYRGTIGEVRHFIGQRKLGTDLVPGFDLATYLGRLREDGATSDSTLGYARTVRAHYALRTIASHAIPDGSAGLPEQRVALTFDRLDALRTELAEASMGRAEIGSVAEGVLERAIAISEGRAEEPGVTTGLPDLDRAMLGYRPGELIIVAGRPGMGKSTLGTSSACHTADPHAGSRTAGALYFGLELGAEAIGARCLADLAYARHESPTHSAIRSGRLAGHEIALLRHAQARLNELDLVVDSRSAATVGEIEATCLAVSRRLEKRGRTLGVVFIDYLKQVSAGDRYRGNRVYEIGEITAGLRDMGKRLGICVVLLTQLNRGVESRDDKRPTLADLRESGDLENDADVVLLLYREAYYLRRDLRAADAEESQALQHKLEMVEHELEIIIAKNRNGEGEHTVKAFCDIGRSAVRSMARG